MFYNTTFTEFYLQNGFLPFTKITKRMTLKIRNSFHIGRVRWPPLKELHHQYCASFPKVTVLQAVDGRFLSGQSLKEQDLLIDAEPVQYHHQVLPTTGHLALHGQTEVLFHALSDATSDCVVPEGSDRETDNTRVSSSSTCQCFWDRNEACLKLKCKLSKLKKQKLSQLQPHTPSFSHILSQT